MFMGARGQAAQFLLAHLDSYAMEADAGLGLINAATMVTAGVVLSSVAAPLAAVRVCIPRSRS